MQKEQTYSRWFIIPENEYARTHPKGVEPNGKTFKGERFAGVIYKKDASYFSYGGGIKLSNMERHYPKSSGFELIPIPNRVPIIEEEGIWKVDEIKLAKVEAEPRKIRHYDTKKGAGKSGEADIDVKDPKSSHERKLNLDTRQDEVEVEVEDEDDTQIEDGFQERQELDYLLDDDENNETIEDFEPVKSKKTKLETPNNEIIMDRKEQKEEEEKEGEKEKEKEAEDQIIINITGSNGQYKLKKPSQKKTYEDFFPKKPRKSRKCKKTREADPVQQCKEAIKHLLTDVTLLKSDVFNLHSEQLQNTQSLLNLAVATKETRNKVDHLVTEMREDSKEQTAQALPVSKRIILKNKTLPEWANI